MSKVEAYKKAKYKGNPYKNAWEIAENPVISKAIDERLNTYAKESEDIRRGAMIEAREKQIYLMRSAENEFVQLNATKEILADTQKINIGGQKGNPLGITIISPAGDKIEIDDDA